MDEEVARTVLQAESLFDEIYHDWRKSLDLPDNEIILQKFIRYSCATFWKIEQNKLETKDAIMEVISELRSRNECWPKDQN